MHQVAGAATPAKTAHPASAMWACVRSHATPTVPATQTPPAITMRSRAVCVARKHVRKMRNAPPVGAVRPPTAHRYALRSPGPPALHFASTPTQKHSELLAFSHSSEANAAAGQEIHVNFDLLMRTWESDGASFKRLETTQKVETSSEIPQELGVTVSKGMIDRVYSIDLSECESCKRVPNVEAPPRYHHVMPADTFGQSPPPKKRMPLQ